MLQESVDSESLYTKQQAHTHLDRVHVKSIDSGYECTKDFA